MDEALDRSDRIGCNATLAAQAGGAVDERMRHVAGGIGLQRYVAHVSPPAEIARDDVEVSPVTAEMAAVEAEAAVEYGARSGEAARGQAHRDQAAVCGPPGMDALRPRAVGEELHQPRRHAP